jgi:hypothetical protein
MRENVVILTHPSNAPKKTEHNDFFSCGRGLLMLTGRRYQKTSSPLAEGWQVVRRIKEEFEI